MTLILQIALGVLLGGWMLIATAIFALNASEKIDDIKRRRRMGFAW